MAGKPHAEQVPNLPLLEIRAGPHAHHRWHDRVIFRRSSLQRDAIIVLFCRKEVVGHLEVFRVVNAGYTREIVVLQPIRIVQVASYLKQLVILNNQIVPVAHTYRAREYLIDLLGQVLRCFLGRRRCFDVRFYRHDWLTLFTF